MKAFHFQIHQTSQGQAPTNPTWNSPWADHIEQEHSTKKIFLTVQNQIPWKLVKGRKRKKREIVRKNERRGDKRDRKQREKKKDEWKSMSISSCESPSKYSLRKYDIQLSFSNVASSTERERGGSSHSEKSIETILGNCIGALILSNFRFWQKGWGLFLHSFAWSRAHFEILFRQRKRKELGPKRAGGWRER